MAQLITVRLSRDGGCPWGFRLQGGKDFGTPLVIQKVNGGSPAERAGLVAGDSVIRVNTTDVFNLRHKDAQDVIVRAGQSFEMTVQRGGSTWKPSVTPVGNVPRAQPISNNVSPVTKTSLAAQNQSYTPIGSSHNTSARGFSAAPAPAPAPHMNGDGPKLVNKQYNTPIGLYSEQSIAETLSAQAEVLSTGALGVNFKKNEKNYDAEKSEVYKMLQEAEREPRTPEPVMETDSGVVSAPPPAVSAVAGLRHVPAPIDRPAPANPTNPLPPGQNICADCERLIVGVFVRIKDKNLHVECFKCATCGTSLKNVGYYNINNKLYCDIHAKLAARNNPPAPNLVPLTIPPGGKVPSSAISAALASHSLPSPSPLSPSGNQVAAPFSPPLNNSERYANNNYYNNQKLDAVTNLMSTLNMASQKEYKENGTNTDLYFTEKTFPVNNNISNIRESQFTSPPPIKYMPCRPKSASSFSGPRPFSSVAAPSTPSAAPYSSMPSMPSTPISAPIAAPLSNTLPRSGSSATIPERKEWPPSKPDEEIPTACPLYINPASRNTTPLPKSNPETSNPGNSTPNPESQNPNPVFIPIAPNPPVSQNPRPQPQNPQNPYPQPQISQNPCPQAQNPYSQNPCPQTQNPYSQNPCPQAQNPYSQNPCPQTQNPYSQNPCPQAQNPYSQNPCPQTQNPYSQNPCPQAQNPYSQNPCPQAQNPYSQPQISQNPCPHAQNPYSQPQISQNPCPQTQTCQNICPRAQISQNPYPQPQISQNPRPQPQNPYPQPQISQNPHPQSQNPCPQPQISQNPYPQSQNPQNPYPQSQNPQITISQNSPPSVIQSRSQVQQQQQQQQQSSDYRATQENIARNMSICSAEVTNITGRRSVMECVETVSGAIDTQILVNQVTKTKERPKSPPPIPRKDSVYDTQDISIVVSTKTPGGKTSETPVLTIEENPQTCNPQCPMVNPDCNINIITCPRNNPTCPVQQNIQSSSVQSSSVESASSKQAETKVSQTTAIKNPVPQEYISPMVKALTVASDRPFNTVSVEIKSKQYGTGKTTQEIIQTSETTMKSASSAMQASQMKSIQEVQETRAQRTVSAQEMQESRAQRTVSAQEMQESRSKVVQQSQNVIQETKDVFPHVRAPVKASPMASALTIAPSTPFTPSPQITMDPVPLPPESTPYYPPEIPITVEPKVQKQATSCKSPFVDALTTAPERAYTPLVGGQEQPPVPDFMKDVPAPPKHKMSMLSALTTASERAFTPALSIGSIEDILLKPAPEPVKQKVIPPPGPITIKPASHVSPSAFRPIGNGSFKPVQQVEVPKPVTSFPPISDELKSNFAPSPSLCFATPSQIPAMQRYQQQTTQQVHQEEQQRVETIKAVSSGLHSATSIPDYQIKLSRRDSHPEQVFVPESQIRPKQKPVTTLQPGQYQPNNHLQTFQPVMEESHRQYLGSSPLPRAISPSMINKPAPSIPYYQADLVAHECQAVGSNLLDPRSPAISRSPSPCPGQRSSSPFPRTMSKSPAQGPPPNPLKERMEAKKPPVRDERYLEARENLTSYIPKYQGRVEQLKSQLTVGGQSQMSSGQLRHGQSQQSSGQLGQYSGQSQQSSGQLGQYSGQSQQSSGQLGQYSGQSQQSSGQLGQYSGQFQQSSGQNGQVRQYSSQSQLSSGQQNGQVRQFSSQSQLSAAQISAQAQSYQNIQLAHSERQQQSQNCKMSEVQDLRHMEQLNKSQSHSIESSADNRVQIQRTKRCTEEYERTQKEKTIEIQRTGQSITHTISPGSFGFQRQISLEKAPKPVAPSSRSYSLPGSAAAVPKPLKPSPLAGPQPGGSASRPNVPQPYAGGAATGRQAGAIGVAPRRGRGILNLNSAPGSRIPLCGHCNMHIRGPFITALGKIWCPEHFICTTPTCRRPLQDMGFVEERGQLYCEFCFEQYLAPLCAKCNSKIKGDCLNAIGKHYHPECFNCAYCSKLFGNSPFFLEDGLPYCEADWNELFTTKCFACGFPVEAGDRWVEALNNNYHSQCFNCTMCKKNLEGQSFYAKGGRPFCKNHAR